MRATLTRPNNRGGSGCRLDHSRRLNRHLSTLKALIDLDGGVICTSGTTRFRALDTVSPFCLLWCAFHIEPTRFGAGAGEGADNVCSTGLGLRSVFAASTLTGCAGSNVTIAASLFSISPNAGKFTSLAAAATHARQKIFLRLRVIWRVPERLPKNLRGFGWLLCDRSTAPRLLRATCGGSDLLHLSQCAS